MIVEQNLNYFFFDKQILDRALTRKDYALEQRQNNQVCEDQELYQALGSRVLKTVLTELLIRSGCSSNQDLNVKRNRLERPEVLTKISQRLELSFFIKLSTEEKQQHAQEQSHVLIETLEALIGAIYFDGGFSAARNTIKALFKDFFSDQKLI